jgi:hypothetical protein
MRVKLADIVPGMILTKPATNHQGQVLLPAGAEIAEKHLRIFKTWGIREIEVDAPDEDDAPGPVDPDEEVARIRARFERTATDPLAKRIMNALVKRARSES